MGLPIAPSPSTGGFSNASSRTKNSSSGSPPCTGYNITHDWWNAEIETLGIDVTAYGLDPALDQLATALRAEAVTRLQAGGTRTELALSCSSQTSKANCPNSFRPRVSVANSAQPQTRRPTDRDARYR
jgi:hypothetical protein